MPQQPTGSMSEGDTAGGGDPARCALAGLVPATGQLAADRLGAQSGHCRCWWIRFVAFRRGRCQRLAPRLPTGSMSEGDTAAAGDPVRAVPAVPVPATGQPAADRLGAQSGHCRCWWIRFVAFRRGRFQRLAPGLLMSSAPRVATAGAGDLVCVVPAASALLTGEQDLGLLAATWD